MTFVRALLGALCLVLVLPAAAEPGRDPGRLRAAVDAVLDQGSYARAEWGVLVVSLDRGDTLVSRNAHTALTPASNMKVLTSAAALHHLGADYRYTTWVLADGPIVDGVVEGDLVLYGTGDPGIADRFFESRGTVFEQLAADLRAAGIREIRGSVVGDGSRFAGDLRSAAWEPEDVNEWFAAPSGALSYNENVVSVRVSPGEPGEAPIIGSIPDHSGLPVRNEGVTVTGAARPPLALLREDPDDPVLVYGEIRAGGADVWRQMTITDPALFAAHGLTHVLREEGIAVDGAPTSLVEQARTRVGSPRITVPGTDAPAVLAIHRSPPLSTYLRAVNQRSHNLYADLILKTLGWEMAGEGSFEAGARVVHDWLVDIGIPTTGLRILDGSGLAPENRVSAATLVAVIEATSESDAWDAFWESLPEAGDRTLNRRMRSTPAAGNLRAKTGTIRRVSSLSGMVRSADGERLAFAIIGNQLPSQFGAKRLEDRVGEALARYSR
ncbi:MAG TPA: D-alanyl-D-alanine carboxypeptidase/D-alanyl-D-alanine-endopeptidase [Longimicrobiales bacterium]|nr:D-alanyl-D-alanine carboxypeptidase/D-alanyl-D-alanine-endopeptidase [Longimicrobiales bacterium]